MSQRDSNESKCRNFNLISLSICFSAFFAGPPDKLAEALIFTTVENGFRDKGKYSLSPGDISLKFSAFYFDVVL